MGRRFEWREEGGDKIKRGEEEERRESKKEGRKDPPTPDLQLLRTLFKVQ